MLVLTFLSHFLHIQFAHCYLEPSFCSSFFLLYLYASCWHLHEQLQSYLSFCSIQVLSSPVWTISPLERALWVPKKVTLCRSGIWIGDCQGTYGVADMGPDIHGPQRQVNSLLWFFHYWWIVSRVNTSRVKSKVMTHNSQVLCLLSWARWLAA